MHGTIGTIRTIHPDIIAAIGEPAALLMLELAKDLRSGKLSAEEYDQRSFCGTACCIAGHLFIRDYRLFRDHIYDNWLAMPRGEIIGLNDLFASYHPSNPVLAADAIERYIFANALHPWSTD